MLRILCLDIEGGFGGSSRSLLQSLAHLPKGAVKVEVWCRRPGPNQERYAALGIPCRVVPEMPHISSLPRFSRNLYVFGRLALRWGQSRDFRRQLAAAARDRFDLVHFNHEGLFLLARDMRRTSGRRARLTMHVRTHLPSTIFSRWQYRTIADNVDRTVFITEMERDNISRLTRREPNGEVIYNIVSDNGAITPNADIEAIPGIKIASVSNYAWARGNDRLIDVAVVLKARGRHDIHFIVAGDMKLSGTLPDRLGRIAAAGGSLEEYADQMGVGDMFHFLGHVANPEEILAACDLLARGSRADDPWSREILEALAQGIPVVTTGTYPVFVENGVTGILINPYKAEEMADRLIELANSKAVRARYSKAARERIAELCHGPSRAQDLLRVWQSVCEME